MKKPQLFFTIIFFTTIGMLSWQHSFSQNAKTLPATEFSNKIYNDTAAVILDVRTPAEFEKGHIHKAININWNAPGFGDFAKNINKEKNIYLYCLSGGRSSKAASELRSQGYNIFELEGGLLKWRAANLPEDRPVDFIAPELTVAAFKDLIRSEKTVLVDFYAEWCAPCKIMEPYLKEIATEMESTVKVIRIDADKNQNLLKELSISALPVLRIYKKNKLYWYKRGYVSKAELLKYLK